MKILLDEQLSSDLILYFPSSFQVWVNIEGFAAVEKIQTIQKILSPDQIIFI